MEVSTPAHTFVNTSEMITIICDIPQLSHDSAPFGPVVFDGVATCSYELTSTIHGTIPHLQEAPGSPQEPPETLTVPVDELLAAEDVAAALDEVFIFDDDGAAPALTIGVALLDAFDEDTIDDDLDILRHLGFTVEFELVRLRWRWRAGMPPAPEEDLKALTALNDAASAMKRVENLIAG